MNTQTNTNTMMRMHEALPLQCLWSERLTLPLSAWLLLALILSAIAPPAHAVTAKTPGVFAVSPTGEGTYTMPITLPPGTSGLTPSLAFVYGSQRGNGLLGMGLRVTGFSAITRCAGTIAQDGDIKPVLNTAADKLCLDGNKLRLTGGTSGSTASTYQTELETFAVPRHLYCALGACKTT